MSKKVTVRVTAKAGRFIAGVGSREYGETFELEPGVAEYVSELDGFDVVQAPKTKAKAKPAAPPEMETAPDTVKDN
jgi:hypothetical protein